MPSLTFTTCQAQCTEQIISAVSTHLSQTLNIPTTAIEDIPWQERIAQIADGRIDIGWVCGSYYTHLVAQPDPAIELLVAPVMNQPHYQNQPVYYSHVVVRADSPHQTFDHLRGASFAYNEPGSVSGCWTMRYHLATLGEEGGFFDRLTPSGGHLNSLKMIQAGQVDTAAIDSTVWDYELAQNPELVNSFRIVETLGPTPIPPWVIRRSLPDDQKQALRQALITMPDTENGRTLLNTLHLHSFSPVPDSHYNHVRTMLQKAAAVNW